MCCARRQPLTNFCVRFTWIMAGLLTALCVQMLLPGAPLLDALSAAEAQSAYYRPDKLIRTGAGSGVNTDCISPRGCLYCYARARQTCIMAKITTCPSLGRSQGTDPARLLGQRHRRQNWQRDAAASRNCISTTEAAGWCEWSSTWGGGMCSSGGAGRSCPLTHTCHCCWCGRSKGCTCQPATKWCHANTLLRRT